MSTGTPVISANSGTPVVGEPGGGGGGAMQLIQEFVNPVGPSVTFANIPQTFKHLLLLASVAPSTNEPTLTLTINGAPSGYAWLMMTFTTAGVTPSSGTGSGALWIPLGPSVDGRPNPGVNIAMYTVRINGYTAALSGSCCVRADAIAGQGGAPYCLNTQTVGLTSNGGLPPVTNMVVAFSDASNFSQPTVISLYGLN